MKKSYLQKRALQIAVAVCGIVPVAAGLAGIVMGPGMADRMGAYSTGLDSHYRYLSGLLLAIGLGFWSTIPHIEKQTLKFRLLTAIVVIGGFSRLVSAYVLGWPDRPMLFGLGMELIVTPLLGLWQFRVAKARGKFR